MSKQVINITKIAGKKLIDIAKTHQTKSILFSVKGGGCNGFGYMLKPIDNTMIEPKDEIVKYEDIN